MKSIDVPQLTHARWKENLKVIGRLTGCDLLLMNTNAGKRNLLVRSSAFSEAFVDSLRDKAQHLVANELGDNLQFSFTLGDRAIVLYIVRWPSHVHYAYLFVVTEAQALSQDALLLTDNLKSQIEQELAGLIKQAAASTHLNGVFDAPDFQDFIDSFDDHMWIKNPQGKYVQCNQAAYRTWNKRPEELIGKTDFELQDEEIARKFIAADNMVVRMGKQMVVEECLDTNDRENKTWHETIKLPLIGKEGELIGTIGMTRNITNRKLIEEQLMIAGTVFENSVEGVIIADVHGNIVYVNQAFSDITGYSQAEAIGRNPRFLKSGRHDDAFYDEMWQALGSEGRWQGELWNRRNDGAIYPELATISVVTDEKGVIRNYVAVFIDISQQKRSEAELMHMAYHDPLTDLPNRTKLINQIEHEIHHVKRHGGRLATIFIDIDHFKHINDTYGHLIGDEVLCAIAERLTDCVREEDTVSRIGGDEFVILVSNVRHLDAVSTVVDKLKKLFEQRVSLSNGEQLRLTGSMGVSVYPEDGQESETLLRNADTAMYRAKNSGRNNHAFYTQALTDESVFQLRLQGAIHEALEKNAFYLVYQPQYQVAGDQIVSEPPHLAGFEALIRWQHESLGAISPLEFIPVAEKLGLIHEIGYWVLESACIQGMKWLKQGYEFGHIAVNVAGPQLERADFVTKVMAILGKTGFPAQRLELEVTESSMMHNSEEAIKHLQVLKGNGVAIAIDDFGTGYSSLSYLQKLPLDKIKIDRSFINGLPDNQHNQAIVDAVVALGKALNLSVIAEGVETNEQLTSLKERGCHHVQGYLLGKPAEPQDAQALLVDVG